MILRDLTNPDILKITTKGKSVAVIPVGSIEQHGPHLPVSTDSDIVSHVAEKISKKVGYLLLPTIQYGVSFEHSPFVNLSITSQILQRMLVEICLSLGKNHIRKAIILNGHHGNQDGLKQVPSIVAKKTNGRMRVFVYSYWHFMKRPFDHAGFVETSLMLAISNNVCMKKAEKGLIPENFSKKELSKLSKIANKSFPSATKNGVWGDPRKSSAKEGKKILNEIISSIVKESQTCLTGKSRKLHQ